MADEIMESRPADDTCERCTARDAKSYIVTKGDAEIRRTFCEKCAAITADTYPLKHAGKSAASTKDEGPQAVTKSPSGRNP